MTIGWASNVIVWVAGILRLISHRQYRRMDVRVILEMISRNTTVVLSFN